MGVGLIEVLQLCLQVLTVSIQLLVLGSSALGTFNSLRQTIV
jgi:hypothetical protein